MAAPTVTQFRCGLYARVSTKDKGQEVENQLRRLREFAAQSSWSIAAEYIDHDSAKISDRIKLQIMFAAAWKRLSVRHSFSAAFCNVNWVQEHEDN